MQQLSFSSRWTFVPLGQFLQFLDELLKLLAVEFVVAEHVNDGPVRKGLQCPFQAIAAGADVAGQNDGIRLQPPVA